MEPLIISVAVTGGVHGREDTPYIPLTEPEIADAAYEAHQAGAAIVHIHARDDAGRPSHEVARYRAVIDDLRDRCDMLVNVTTAPGGTVPHEERMQSLDAGPDLASFDAGTLEGPGGGPLIRGTVPWLRELAVRMRERGVKPELECFHGGMVQTCLRLADEGVIDEPLFFQFVLGVPGCSPATADELMHLQRMIPPGSPWSVARLGGHGVDMAMLAIILGGHVRCGLEDQVLYSDGALARSNAELVERVVRIAREHGRPVAKPVDAGRILGLHAQASRTPPDEAS